jgi:hypothetical protein
MISDKVWVRARFLNIRHSLTWAFTQLIQLLLALCLLDIGLAALHGMWLVEPFRVGKRFLERNDFCFALRYCAVFDSLIMNNVLTANRGKIADYSNFKPPTPASRWREIVPGIGSFLP